MTDATKVRPVNGLPPKTPWPRNLWYVCCWADQLDDGAVVACTTAGENVVVYRKANGETVALEDRCAHRSAPLSLGKREGDDIRCMYHGFRWGADGRCNHIPIQSAIPAQACVRTFPVTEVDGWIWIWPGEASLADTALIPRSFDMKDSRCRTRHGQMQYGADFQLLNDNLLDLSHLSFLHPTTLAAGAPEWGVTKPDVQQIDRGVRVGRWMSGIKPPPYASKYGEVLDMWSSYDYLVPGIFLLTTAWYPAGTSSAVKQGTPNMPPLVVRSGKQAVTPVEEGSLRYFFAVTMRSEDIGETEFSKIYEVVCEAFEEDRAIIQAQQKVLERSGGASMVLSVADAAPVMFRRIMRELCNREGL